MSTLKGDVTGILLLMSTLKGCTSLNVDLEIVT